MQVDIYCRVIDNWGDAGVCWRLARHLVAKQQAQVRLVIDEPKTLALLGAQALPNLAICDWSVAQIEEDIEPTPNIIIAAFGCELPSPVRARIKTATKKTLWINLEYLSAESWTTSHHWLPSIKPDGACEMFYMPGFTTHTGGVLTEEWELPTASELIKQLGLKKGRHNERWASVFCYPNANIESLKYLTTPWRLLVPDAVTINVEAMLESNTQVTVQRIPQLNQLQYDTLLGLCDFNFVRGEDSWVRAQIAGKPFLWQPYQQSENSHQTKLEAFVSLVEQTNQMANPIWRTASLEWSGLGLNQDKTSNSSGSEAASLLDSNLANWQQQSEFFSRWREKLLKNEPLCAQIIGRYQHWARIQGLAEIS